MQKQTICLNMIVKNESHIIEKTLENIYNNIKISYWVISDTGSTDNTVELITTFFNKLNIKGEITHDKWLDFGHNRTVALNKAYNKTDYLLIFDADDKIIGELNIPENLEYDSYLLKIGKDFTYNRPLLINNRKKWKFVGVLHEYLQCLEYNNKQLLEGSYYIESGRIGNRSKQTNKYIKDAEILKEAYEKEKNNNKQLSYRYSFYCAQSYKDAGYIDESINWYEQTLKLDGWIQEKYYSCLKLSELYEIKKNKEKIKEYLLKAINYDTERMDGLIRAVELYYNEGNHLFVNMFYHKFKEYKINYKDKLFVTSLYYNNMLEYYNSISAFYINDKKSGYECVKKIIINKKIENNKYILTINNLQYYLNELKQDNNTEELFNKLTDAYIINKNDVVNSNTVNIWNILLEKNKSILTNPICYNHKEEKFPKIIITFTTCKRLDLFKQTVNSILNTWLDKDKIDYWYCVDDNSSIEDREYMIRNYPWIKYYMKSEEEKGHRTSMNIIWKKLKELKSKYWIHMEDDFLFYKKMNYIEESIKGLEITKKDNVKQILFNRNYGETIQDYRIIGHKVKNNDIVIHNNKEGIFEYNNCHYWPHYSFRPSIIEVETILELGNYDSSNTFFEMDYAKRWTEKGYKSGFFNYLTNQHIGKLTSDKRTPNAYILNNEIQFNSNYIKIVNLKRRKDRKEYTKKLFEKENIKNYEFYEAIDGNELELTNEIVELFQGNDFGSKKGVIGCALSHYNLWKKLIEDKETNYYLILEDDIQDYYKLNETIKNYQKEMINKELIFFGYSMFEKNRNKEIYNSKNNDVKIEQLQKQNYIGGTFMYSINKIGAKKILDYISKNGIKHGIDYVIKITPKLECYESRPQIVFSEWNENGKKIDSDIQNMSNSFDFTKYTRKIRIKLLCSWCNSKQLCEEWKNMYNNKNGWNNLEITHENNEIDYYVIINRPSNNEYYDSKKTFVFQMEPWVYKKESNWGVKTWGEWAIPDSKKFLDIIGRHTNSYNNVFWQLELTYDELVNLKYEKKMNRLSSICSSKYFDEGHVARIDFLKYLENKKDIDLDIYNQDNIHNFINYKGKLTPYKDKSKGIVPYKYYFMVENNYEPNFITEKLWEPIISETLCFYYGCHNVSDYVNSEAYVQLDMNDFEKSYNIIKTAIKEDLWTQRIDKIKEEKKRLLNEMQFFPRLEGMIKKLKEKPKNVCFIHSCSLNNNKRLEYLINYLEHSELYNNLDKIYINNIGKDLTNKYSSKFEIINYSNNTHLYEIPTLNKLIEYSNENENDNVLYIHNKGISYNDNYQEVNDWIDMMLYFLIDKYEECLEDLKKYNTVGCNYSINPKKHFSGNFWWSQSKYLKKLTKIDIVNIQKADAEWLLFTKDPTYVEIHNSNVNHYQEQYPKHKYVIKNDN